MSSVRHPLVIGAGFLGMHLIRHIVDEKLPLRVLTRSPVEVAERELIGNADVRVHDATVQGTVADALGDIDHVFWCAGGLMPADSNLDPATDAALALPPLLRTLEELRARPGVGLTFLSSGGTVYGNPTSLPVQESHPTDPLSSYGIMKLASEKYALMYAELYGIPVQILRCSNVYGELQPPDRGQGLIATALRHITDGEPIIVFGDGLNIRDYVYADDVADVMLRLATADEVPSVLNVGSNEGVTILDLVALIEDVTGRRATIEHQPDRGLDVRKIVLDTTALRHTVRWNPRPLRAGLERTASARGLAP